MDTLLNTGLPETVIYPLADDSEPVLRQLANQADRERFAVGDLQEITGGLVQL